MLLSTIEPGSDSEDYFHDGAEAGYVLSGTLDLWVSGRHFRLHEGDSFSFKSTDVHRCANPGEVPVRVIWVITPPHYWGAACGWALASAGRTATARAIRVGAACCAPWWATSSANLVAIMSAIWFCAWNLLKPVGWSLWNMQMKPYFWPSRWCWSVFSSHQHLTFPDAHQARLINIGWLRSAWIFWLFYPLHLLQL